MHNEKPCEQNATGSSLGFHSRRALASFKVHPPGVQLCAAMILQRALADGGGQWWTFLRLEI